MTAMTKTEGFEPKVIIADDHPLFRTALKHAIVECIDDANTLEAESFAELLTIIEQTPSLEISFFRLTHARQQRLYWPNATAKPLPRSSRDHGIV